jgi:hypothetical protein
MMRRLRRWDRKGLGLVLALLVVAVGFCVFDGDQHEGDHGGVDLCLGMLAVVVTVGLASRLPLAGSTCPDGLALVVQLPPRVPAPPPKRVLV